MHPNTPAQEPKLGTETWKKKLYWLDITMRPVITYKNIVESYETVVERTKTVVERTKNKNIKKQSS